MFAVNKQLQPLLVIAPGAHFPAEMLPQPNMITRETLRPQQMRRPRDVLSSRTPGQNGSNPGSTHSSANVGTFGLGSQAVGP